MAAGADTGAVRVTGASTGAGRGAGAGAGGAAGAAAGGSALYHPVDRRRHPC